MVAGPGEAGFESVGEDVSQTETGETSEAQVSLDRTTFDAPAEIQAREELTVQASEELEQEVREAVEAVLDTAAADPTEITFSPDDVLVDGAGEGGMAIGAAPVETDSNSVGAAGEVEDEAPPPEAADSGIAPSSPPGLFVPDYTNHVPAQEQQEGPTQTVQGPSAAQLDELQTFQPGTEDDSGQDTREERPTPPDAQEMERYYEPERTTLQDRAEAMTAQDEEGDESNTLRTAAPSLGSQTEAVPAPETDSGLPEDDKPDSADPLSISELLNSQQIHDGLISDGLAESNEGDDQVVATPFVGGGHPLGDGLPVDDEVRSANLTSDGQRDASDSPVESIKGEYQVNASNEVELVINEGADSVSEDTVVSDPSIMNWDNPPESTLMEFLRLHAVDPITGPPPEFDETNRVEVVTGTEALIANYEQTIEILEDDLQQLWVLLEEMPEGAQSSESFTFHLPVRSADGTYQLIEMPLLLSSANIQAQIPVLQALIIQIQMQMAAIE